MLFNCLMRKKEYLSFFLITIIFTSCCPPCHQWKLASIKGDCPSSNYIKAYLPTRNTFNGIEPELVCTNGLLQLYLNAHSLQFPCNSDNHAQTNVEVIIGDQDYCFIAERLEGGQRLLLPNEALEIIVCSLLEKNNVEITIGRYESTLIYEGFPSIYNSLIKISAS